MTTRLRHPCVICGMVLPAWLPVAKRPEASMLLYHLSQHHLEEVRPYLARMEVECIATVAAEAYEVVEEDSRMMLAKARRHVWTRQVSGGVLVALLLVPAVVQAQPMRWPEAVAALAAERTRAETCGRLLKRHAGDNTAALSRGELAYATAKADVDAVIAGLTVVLAQRGTPWDLADVEAQLTRGVQAREAFCTQAIALVPPDPGTRNLVGELVGALVKPLVDAVVTMHTLKTDQDRLLRQTIQTQLEATTWTPFADLTP